MMAYYFRLIFFSLLVAALASLIGILVFCIAMFLIQVLRRRPLMQ